MKSLINKINSKVDIRYIIFGIIGFLLACIYVYSFVQRLEHLYAPKYTLDNLEVFFQNDGTSQSEYLNKKFILTITNIIIFAVGIFFTILSYAKFSTYKKNVKMLIIMWNLYFFSFLFYYFPPENYHLACRGFPECEFRLSYIEYFLYGEAFYGDKFFQISFLLFLFWMIIYPIFKSISWLFKTKKDLKKRMLKFIKIFLILSVTSFLLHITWLLLNGEFNPERLFFEPILLFCLLFYPIFAGIGIILTYPLFILFLILWEIAIIYTAKKVHDFNTHETKKIGSL